MALVDCPECRREVSSTAVTCPHCGHGLKGEICPWCGRPKHCIRLVQKPGGLYYECTCGGVWPGDEATAQLDRRLNPFSRF